MAVFPMAYQLEEWHHWSHGILLQSPQSPTENHRTLVFFAPAFRPSDKILIGFTEVVPPKASRSDPKRSPPPNDGVHSEQNFVWRYTFCCEIFQVSRRANRSPRTGPRGVSPVSPPPTPGLRWPLPSKIHRRVRWTPPRREDLPTAGAHIPKETKEVAPRICSRPFGKASSGSARLDLGDRVLGSDSPWCNSSVIMWLA